MDINNFFEVEESKKKIVLVDYNGLMMRLIFGAQNQYLNSIKDQYQETNTEDLYRFWKIGMINSIFKFIKQFQPDKMFLAVDCKKSPYWRKDFYPPYKEGRKEKLDASAIDFKEFYKVANEFLEELKTILPNIYVMNLEKCEADDIIAVLSRDVFNEHDVTVISSDGDFKQLLKYSHIKLWNDDSRVKSYMNCINPKEELNLKVIIGDGGNNQGDNIPNILVMEHLPNGLKTIGVGEVAAQKILEKGLDSDFVIEKVYDKYNEFEGTGKKKRVIKENIGKEDIQKIVKENYHRNLKLISFDEIPIEIKNKIIEGYEKYELGNVNGKEVFNWVIKHEVNLIVDSFQVYSPLLKHLG